MTKKKSCLVNKHDHLYIFINSWKWLSFKWTTLHQTKQINFSTVFYTVESIEMNLSHHCVLEGFFFYLCDFNTRGNAFLMALCGKLQTILLLTQWILWIREIRKWWNLLNTSNATFFWLLFDRYWCTTIEMLFEFKQTNFYC